MHCYYSSAAVRILISLPSEVSLPRVFRGRDHKNITPPLNCSVKKDARFSIGLQDAT